MITSPKKTDIEKTQNKNGRLKTLFLFTLAIIVSTTFIRYRDVVIDVPISYSLFTLISWLLINKGYSSVKETFIGFSISLFALELFAIIVDGTLPSIGLPNIIASFLGIVSGCIIGSKKAIIGIKFLTPIIVFSFSVWYIGGGYNNWFNFLEEGTLTGSMKKEIKKCWLTYTKEKDTLSNSFYKNKTVLLDFWTTSCGVCFKKFPDLERLYQKYKDHPSVIIQAVNIPLERDSSGMAFYMVEKYGKFTFPVVVGNKAMNNLFEISAYPTIVLIKNNEVIFKGRMELAEHAIENALN